MFLSQIFFHVPDGYVKEEMGEVFVSTFCANLLQGCNILLTLFKIDDELRMPLAHKDIVAQQTACTSIAITERMQILVISIKT